MTIQSMENIGIVVEDLDAVKRFFIDLGLKLLGEGSVEGEWVDRIVGLEGVRQNVAMLETLDGNGRVELMQIHHPEVLRGDGNAAPNTLGIRRIAFTVDDVDADVAGLRARGLELVGEVVNFEDVYRMCYVRGPEGIMVMLAQKLG